MNKINDNEINIIVVFIRNDFNVILGFLNLKFLILLMLGLLILDLFVFLIFFLKDLKKILK
jgi:hypothetical protein